MISYSRNMITIKPNGQPNGHKKNPADHSAGFFPNLPSARTLPGPNFEGIKCVSLCLS